MSDSTSILLDGQAEIRDGWVSLLSRYEWDAFGTFTFNRDRRDMFEAVKPFSMLMFRWAEREAETRGLVEIIRKPRVDVYGREIGQRVKRRGPWWNAYRKGNADPVTVVGVELQPCGRVHLHTLMKFPELMSDWSRRRGWSLWTENKPGCLGLGWSRIEEPKNQGDVMGYCSKYVVKGGELVLSPSFTSLDVGATCSTDKRLEEALTF